MPLYREIRACRACGSTELPEALSLGEFSLSDFLDSPDAHTDHAPLVLVRCQNCTLVQLRHTVDRDRLFRSTYWYRSGTQPAMVSALRDVVREATTRVDLRAGDAVVDIGANDGTLLRMFPESTVRVAYEPAANLQHALRATGGVTVAGGFFPTVIRDEPVGMAGGAKIITSIACFYDADDPAMFVRGIKKWLAEDGIWINQLAYLPKTLEMNNFGDVCHEHLTYWTVTAFNNLLKQHGLVLLNWSFNDVNGGSVRFIVGHDKGQADLAQDWADNFGLLALKKFGQRVHINRTEIRDFLHRAHRDGKTVLGYAAATKMNTALQYWGIGPDLLPAIADRNPDKHGKYTPTGQVIISEEELRRQKPDYLLCGAFHFLEAFLERERDLLDAGTQFIVPFPETRLVGSEKAAELVSPAA